MALLRLGSQDRVATLETIRPPDLRVRARPVRRTTGSPREDGIPRLSSGHERIGPMKPTGDSPR